MEQYRSGIVISEDDDAGYTDVDFADFLVADLAEVVKDISGYCNGMPSVQFGNTSVTIREQLVDQDARAQLEAVMLVARRVMEQEPHLQPGEVATALLALDGWSWTKVTLRTPLWLHDVQEWPLVLVSEWYEELKCLETYTSL